MKYLENNLMMKIIVSIVVLLVLVAGISFYVNRVSKNVNLEKGTGMASTTATTTFGGIGSGSIGRTAPPPVLTFGSKCGLTITSPALNSKIGFPLVIKGIIDDTRTSKLGCTWNHVQDRAGNAQLFYNLNNQGWKAPGIPVPIITSAGPTASTSAFTVSLNAYTSTLGLVSGTPIKISFSEQKDLDGKSTDSIDIFVKLK